MVTGAVYSEVMNNAVKSFSWDRFQRTFYTTSAQLRTLLHKMNVPARKGRAVRRWSSVSDIAIAGINYSEKRNSWHWVVFLRKADKEYVLDPQSKREIRCDFGKMRLRSYIPIDLTCSGSQAPLGNPKLGSSASRYRTTLQQAELAGQRSQAELGNEGRGKHRSQVAARLIKYDSQP